GENPDWLVGARHRPRSFLVGIFPPDHYHACGYAAAHIEGEVPPRAWNLTRAGLLRELNVGFGHLSHAGRADRVAVAHQPAAGIDRNRSLRLPSPKVFPD